MPSSTSGRPPLLSSFSPQNSRGFLCFLSLLHAAHHHLQILAAPDSCRVDHLHCCHLVQPQSICVHLPGVQDLQWSASSSGTPGLLPGLAPASYGSFHTGPLAPSWLRAFACAVAPLPRPTLPLSLYPTSLTPVLVCSRPHPVGTPPRPGVGTKLPGCQVHVEGEGSEGLSCEGSSMALTGGSRNLWPRGECVGCSALCQPLTWPHGQHCGCVPWATGSPAWHTALGTS